MTTAVDKQPACAVTLGGRSGGLLTHSSYTTSGDTTCPALEGTNVMLEHHWLLPLIVVVLTTRQEVGSGPAFMGCGLAPPFGLPS